MRYPGRLVILLALVLSLASSLWASKIKKRNGETVEGTIEGLIVVKMLESSGAEARPSALYRIFLGDDLLEVDENGFHARPGKTLFLTVHAKEALPYDAAILQQSLKKSSLQYLLKLGKEEIIQTPYSWGDVWECLGCKEDEVKAPPFHLLGEFRPGEGWGTVVPSIRVRTGNTIVVVPVAEVATSDASLGETQTQKEPSAQQIVLSSKTAAVVSSGVSAPKGLGALLTRRGLPGPDAENARKYVTKEIENWKRFTLLSDPAQADLTFRIVAFRTGELLEIYDRNGRMLWRRDVRGEFALRAVRFFRKELENAERGVE